MKLLENFLAELREASAAEVKRYEAELLTPLFTHGWQEPRTDSQGRTRNSPVAAETRPSSLRGVLRYWWRAVNRADRITDLQNKEKRLFGGTGDAARKSPVSLRIFPYVAERNNRIPLRPHRNETPVLAISRGKNLTIELVRLRQVASENMESLVFYDSLMKLFFCLGSMGQRARRGTGALQWKGFVWSSVSDFQNSLRESLDGLHVGRNFSFPSLAAGSGGRGLPWPVKVLEMREQPSDYRGVNQRPLLLNVWVGQPYDDPEGARKAISQAASQCNPPNVPGRRQLLGAVLGGRLSSPLWCTVRKIGNKYHPVVSELHNRHLSGRDREDYLKARNDFLKCLSPQQAGRR